MNGIHVSTANDFLEILDRDRKDHTTNARTCFADDDVWEKLILMEDEVVFAVARNNTIPFSIMKRLAAYPHRDVRMSIAIKNRLSDHPELFGLLLEDSDSGIRGYVGTRNDAPEKIKKLFRSRYPEYLDD